MTRFFDLLFSTLAVLFLLPFMIPVMILLKLTGEHYIFYLQPRVGKHGREFHVIKFATMLRNSPGLPGGFITQKDDPRILPMGSFLRKTKINELPQLLNIVAGQMSIVGPRPVVRAHFDLYPAPVREAIQSMVPGLTGIASLIFRDEEGILDRMDGDRKRNHDLLIAPYKGALEVWYKENRNVLLYFRIIFLTAWAVIRPGHPVAARILRTLPEPPAEIGRLLAGA